MLVEAANEGTMACAQICKNLQWKMQGTQFQADVFVMALQNYDMVLGIQWLKLLGDILANYEDKWMTFWWQGKEVTLKGDNPTLTQSIPLEELNGLLTNTTSWAGVNICSLRVLDDAFVDHEKHFKKEMEQVNGWRIALKEVADLGGVVLEDG
uniref:Uncharacterized protein n=1 Tax=Populus alba TaxID=43335 RepID=A0A4U5NPM1_POPAL|nr:hypothetical protein D5086_0000255440 [Populus alba]